MPLQLRYLRYRGALGPIRACGVQSVLGDASETKNARIAAGFTEPLVLGFPKCS